MIILKDFIILTDTRQQKENHIIKEFDKQGVLHIRTGLKSADYMTIKRQKDAGFYLDYSTLIDTKKDLEEMAGNLCNSQSHERIKREIEKARELGCKNFIFLIGNNKIKTLSDLENWSSDRTQVSGRTLSKIMITMKERYGVRFIIVPKKNMGKKILEIFESEGKQNENKN